MGDVLLVEPGKLEARVRSLHNHDRPVESVRRGQRAALNLAASRSMIVAGGRELASPGHLLESKLLTVRLSLLMSAPRPLKSRDRVRLHVGTAEILASVVLLEGLSLAPGFDWLGSTVSGGAAVTTWNQPFVIRSESPVRTHWRRPCVRPDRREAGKTDGRTLERLAELSSADLINRASAAPLLCRSARLAARRSVAHRRVSTSRKKLRRNLWPAAI